MPDYLDYIQGATGDALAATIAAAISESGKVWSRQLKSMAEVFALRLGNPEDMRAAHHAVGVLAQDSVKRSFDQVVTARQGWAGRQEYRAGASDNHRRRFAGGVMRAALGSPEFFDATPEGLLFVNVSMLNRRAAQWHRLNFGAGAAGTGSTQRFQVTWGSVVVATLGFDEPASAPFVLPRGVWLGPEGPVRSGSFVAGSDMFYPAGEAADIGLARNLTRKSRATRGIVARNFLDAGLRRIGQELPVVYGQLYREWWDQAQSGAGPLTQTVTTPARPSTLSSRTRTL